LKRANIDNEREFDWGRTSTDYAKYRSDYPESFYDTLQILGVGNPGQHILDLGTGTGILARAFAKRGALVTGIDISENQIKEARGLAAAEGVNATFLVCAAEEMEVPDAAFDVISAAQSWLYFDSAVVIPKVLRALKQRGYLVLTHFAWLPFKDPIARQSEALVLKYNPDWKGANYRGTIPPFLSWSQEHFALKTFHLMEEPIAFTRESWRGRIRACRGMGASLSAELIAQFDAEHEQLLRQVVPEAFSILHQMSIHILMRKGEILAV